MFARVIATRCTMVMGLEQGEGDLTTAMIAMKFDQPNNDSLRQRQKMKHVDHQQCNRKFPIKAGKFTKERQRRQAKGVRNADHEMVTTGWAKKKSGMTFPLSNNQPECPIHLHVID